MVCIRITIDFASTRDTPAAPFGVAMTKQVMWSSLEIAGLETAIAMEVRTQALCACSDDHWEAAAAFVEKRPPRFADQ